MIQTGDRHRTFAVPTVQAMPVVERLGGDWDAKMVARIAAGDDDALAAVYDQLAPTLNGLARRISHDAALAEDVVQDVFVTLWQHPDAFDARQGSLRTWLSLLTHRRTVDLIRSRVAAARREDRVRAQERHTPLDVAEAADALLLAERVRAAGRALPDEQRTVIELA